MRRTSARVGLGIGALVVVVSGCTGILGDFDVGGGDGTDGGANDGTTPIGTDGNVPPGTDGGDAPTDAPVVPGDGPTTDAADAGNYLLTCDGFRFASPFVVDSLDSQPTAPRFTSSPRMVSIDSNHVEILEPGHDGVYTLYWVEKQGSSATLTGQFNTPLNGLRALDLQRITGASAILMAGSPPGPFGGESLAFASLPDTVPPGQGPTDGVDLSPARAFFENDFGADFIELNPNIDYAYTYTNVPQDGGAPDGAAELFVGHAYADGGNVAQEKVSHAVQAGSNPVILHDGTALHVIVSSDPSHGGAMIYKAAETATGLDGGETGRPLSQSLPALLIGAAAGDQAAGSSNGFNVAMAEFNPNATPVAVLHSGSVTGAQLDTFTVADLPAGPSFNDTSELPIQGEDSKWVGNEMAMIGIGSPLPKNQGLNFVAMDAQGHTRAVHVGANAILQGHTATTVALSLGQRLGVRYVTWNIAWTETVKSTDGGPDFDRLYLNELICH